MEIYCENNFCVYFEDKKCILDSIALDISGVCAECIHVEIENDILNSERKKLLKRFEQQDKNKLNKY